MVAVRPSSADNCHYRQLRSFRKRELTVEAPWSIDLDSLNSVLIKTILTVAGSFPGVIGS